MILHTCAWFKVELLIGQSFPLVTPVMLTVKKEEKNRWKERKGNGLQDKEAQQRERRRRWIGEGRL